MTDPRNPICIKCSRRPDEIAEYRACGKYSRMTPNEYVRAFVSTYNRTNGHFICTECRIAVGCPSHPNGWIAP